MKKPIQFGKYYLLERINVGGMAEVFKAKAFGVEGFERLLAVKRILPNIAEDKEFIAMFIDEAKIAVQLNHANICQVFDLGKADDSYFIAMEYVHGRDLRAIYDRCKQFPVAGSNVMPIAQSCFVTMKVCEGLDYAHNKRDSSGRELHLVHRDISPQNVLISYEGECKLIDFGIAKAVGKGSKTQAGILKGKFGYMSPEQVRGLPLDRRSDIFSVGICLYELLTGERLFVGESDFSTLEKVRNVEILPPSTYNRKIPDELERIVLKALAKDVEDRYQNAIDLHDDLQAFMYAAGEFYSRKDLAAWMKKQYATEIAEESAKLEAHRQFTPEPVAAVEVRRPTVPQGGGSAGLALASGGYVPAVAPPSARPMPSKGKGNGAPNGNGHATTGSGTHVLSDADLDWDDDEKETHVYDEPKDAEDSIVGELPLGATSGPVIKIDELDLSPDGAPVPAKPRPSQSMPVAAAPVEAAPAPAPAPTPQLANIQSIFDAPLPPPPSSPSSPSFPALQTLEHPVQAPKPTALVATTKRKPAPVGIIAAGAGAVALLVVLLSYMFVYLPSRPGDLQISSDPGVRVFVDGKPAQLDAARQLHLAPGPHLVSVEKDGFRPTSESVDIKAGVTIKRRYDLEPLKMGGFKISDPVGAKVFLDGKTTPLGMTPFKVDNVSSGAHTIEAEWKGQRVTQTFTVEPERSVEVKLAFPGTTPPPVETPATPPPAMVDRTPDRTPSMLPPPSMPGTPTSHHTHSQEVALDDGPHTSRHSLPPPPAIDPTPPEPKTHPVAQVDKTPKPVETSAGDDGAQATLRLNTKPWTNITIDGKSYGHTPNTNIHVGPGSHQVTFANPALKVPPTTITVDVKAGATFTKFLNLEAKAAPAPDSSDDE